jgi:hypothetical protein
MVVQKESLLPDVGRSPQAAEPIHDEPSGITHMVANGSGYLDSPGVNRIVKVGNREVKRVKEYLTGFRKGDAVFRAVGNVLLLVPLECRLR